ncbi:MAG: DUF3159 domain-containing protein [Kineosporiaceae bacterium]
MTEAAPRRVPGGLGRVSQDEPFSVLEVMGGVRGIIESALPALVFSVSYPFVDQVRPCAVAAIAVALIILAVRLGQRQPLTPAVSAFVGVLIAAWVATRTGKAENFFLLTILKNAAWMAAYLVSMLVRWPLLGIFLGQLFGEGFAWRKDPPRRRVYMIATGIWAAMFGLRLVIELALYLPGKVTWLGIATIPLGLPLFAVVLLATWVVVRTVPPTRQAPAEGDEPESGEPEGDEPAAAVRASDA